MNLAAMLLVVIVASIATMTWSTQSAADGWYVKTGPPICAPAGPLVEVSPGWARTQVTGTCMSPVCGCGLYMICPSKAADMTPKYPALASV